MPSLMTLPVELLSKIVGFLDAKSDVANTRLVSHGIESIAAEKLFETATLYPQWFTEGDKLDIEDGLPGPLGYEAKVFMNLVDHERLKKFVKKIEIYTCEPHCDHHPSSLYDNRTEEMASNQKEDIYEQCIERIGEFPNIQGATVHFDRHAGESSSVVPDTLQCEWSRYADVDQVLRVLDGRITDLSIRHYQNGQDKLIKDDGESLHYDEETAADGGTVTTWLTRNLKHLTSLRLSIVHVEVLPEHGSNFRQGDPHTFWSQFPELILNPTQSALKHLVLYSDMPLGFFPKLDLQSTHFPHLQKLVLGQFLFWKDFQWEWVIQHQDTLQELYLDQCSILYQIGFSIENWLDKDGFPQAEPPGDQPIEAYYGWSQSPGEENNVDHLVQAVDYRTRWHDIFLRFLESLRKLHTFKFGSSKKWNFDTRSGFLDGGGSPLPIMPWNSEYDLENRMHEDAYLVYNDWEEVYLKGWGIHVGQDGEEHKHGRNCREMCHWDSELKRKFDALPDCEAEDLAALGRLVEEVAGRFDQFSY